MTNNIKKNVLLGAVTLSAVAGMSIATLANADDNTPKPVKVTSTGTKVTVDDTALKKAVADAKSAGVDVTKEDNDSQSVPFDKYGEAQKSILSGYQTQTDKILDIVKQQQALNDKYNTEKTQYDKDKAQYDKDKAQYDKDKAQYDKDEAQYEKDNDDFKNGTKVTTEMQALTQSWNEDQQYATFMKADVDQKTGDFTLTHDMNDGVSIIGHGVLKGKFNWKVTSKGDGSEVIIADSVTLTSYKYTNEHPNTAINKNISFHVFDNSGKELFSVAHDGQSTFTKNINKTVSLGKNFTLKPNESTDKYQFLKIDDDWVNDTHGQIFAKFTNTNKKPTAPKEPTAPKAPTAPTKTTLKASYTLTDLYVTPQPTKDVDEGENAGDQGGSANNKVINKGDELTYSLKATDLLANRSDDVKTVKYVDTLPKEVDYKSAKVFSADGKTDETKMFDIQYDKSTNKVTVTAKDDFLAEINKDKTKNYVMPVVNIYAVANKGNAKIDNTYDYFLDDSKTQSNTTHNTTPDVKPTKDVDLGTNDGDKEGSDNNKKIVKGQDLTYSLKSTDLPANRAFDVKTFKDVDTLPKEVDYNSTKVFTADGKTDITAKFDVTYDEKTRTVTVTAKDEYLKEMNADKTKAFVKPIVDIYAVANSDNSTIDNKFTEFVNNDSNTSEVVHNTTPEVTPVKKDLDDNGKDINGQDVKPNTIMNYELTWDLTGEKDATIGDDMYAKELSFFDDYDETKLDITAKTKTDFTMTDETTKKSVASEVTLTWDEKKGSWTIVPNDKKAFIKNHGGNKIQIVFKPVVKADATGILSNTAVQNNFGQTYKTETVKNNITPNPKPKPDTPSTPNTSYGERPMGMIFSAIAVVVLGTLSFIFRKPLSQWLKK